MMTLIVIIIVMVMVVVTTPLLIARRGAAARCGGGGGFARPLRRHNGLPASKDGRRSRCIFVGIGIGIGIGIRTYVPPCLFSPDLSPHVHTGSRPQHTRTLSGAWGSFRLIIFIYHYYYYYYISSSQGCGRGVRLGSARRNDEHIR